LGGFAGANVNTCVAAMADITPAKDRVKNFGLIGFASFACGYVVGPSIGGFFSNPANISWFNNSTPFWFSAVWVILNLILVEVFFEETLRQLKHQKIKIFNSLSSIFKIFKYPGELQMAFVVAFLITFGFNFFEQFFQVFLVRKFMFNQFQIAHMLAYLGVWMAISQGLLVRLIPKHLNPSSVLLFTLPAVAIFISAITLPTSPVGLYFILPFVAVFQGIAWPFSSTLLSNMVPSQKLGEILGVNTSLIGLAIGLPPLLSGFLGAENINLPVIFGGVCAFLAFLVVFSQVRSLKSVPSTA
jgi:DHA1 family tetracycline resistance protein-like MFS transporter